MNTEDAFTPEQMTAVVGALHNASMEKWIGAGLICIIGAVVIKIVMQALNRLVAKLPLDKAMLGFLTAAARIVMVIVLATMVAGQLNVPITSLIALLSLFALAVSLSVQDVLANVVSGMVILIAKPFVAGNFISTQNAEGTVERIGLMYTHLVTADNKAVMIPNKEISTERIINYTAKDYRRVDVKLCIGSEIDTDAVLDALAAACKRVEDHPFKAHIDGPAAQMFDTLGRYSTPLYRVIFANMWCFGWIIDLLGKKSGGEMNALVRTTVAFTQMEGSSARNVIPPEAKMVSNIRLNPADSVASALAYLEKTVNDPAVEITSLESFEPSPVSETGCDAWEKVAAAVANTWPGCEEDFKSRDASLDLLAETFHIRSRDPFQRVKELQTGFDPSVLNFSDAYYDTLGLEKPKRGMQRKEKPLFEFPPITFDLYQEDDP